MYQDRKIPAAEFARLSGSREADVVQRIQSGVFSGVEEDGVWYVLSRVPAPPPAPPGGAPRRGLLPPWLGKWSLPWKTVDRSVWWFSPLMMAGVVAAIGLAVWEEPEWLTVLGVLLTLAMLAALIHNALRTGKTLGDAGEMTLGRNPDMYWFRVYSYGCFFLITAFALVAFLIQQVIRWLSP